MTKLEQILGKEYESVREFIKMKIKKLEKEYDIISVPYDDEEYFYILTFPDKLEEEL